MPPAAAPDNAPPSALIEPGKKAPAFTAVDQAGATHKLSDYTGRVVVLYFYPKDDTPGCTTEACEFRDLLPQFTQQLQGTEVAILGVSPDNQQSHGKFVQKFDLNFPLLADPPKKEGDVPPICSKYGVWQEKNMYGRKSMGVVRTTYIIGPDQKVMHRFDKVKAAGHAEKVLEWLRKNAASATA